MGLRVEETFFNPFLLVGQMAHDDKKGQAQYDQGDVAMPTPPNADFIMVQTSSFLAI